MSITCCLSRIGNSVCTGKHSRATNDVTSSNLPVIGLRSEIGRLPRLHVPSNVKDLPRINSFLMLRIVMLRPESHKLAFKIVILLMLGTCPVIVLRTGGLYLPVKLVRQHA